MIARTRTANNLPLKPTKEFHPRFLLSFPFGPLCAGAGAGMCVCACVMDAFGGRIA